MDAGQVDHCKHPDSHQKAPCSQWKMGWKHVFTGHLSQEWEKLQGDIQTDKKTQKVTNWASNLVTIILQQVINLWQVRNEEVHGKAESEQMTKLLN